VSKGKPGSPWETPPGAYQVQAKEENHFSSIGHVWMPYSMQFFGNFFIHGWPYYPNGQAVPKGYSGGCIRLTTEDAAKVYEFADNGTAVYIAGGESPTVRKAADNTAYYLLNNYAPDPHVTASSYLVADLDTGEVILEKNKGMTWPIASVTKLTTALTALEVVNQYKTALVTSSEVATYGDAGHLHKGEELTVHDLLYPLLLESSNDAAEVIADQVGRDNFIKSMNDKVRSIGLTATHYEDPSGLTPKNVSTAEDLFRLLSYIYKYKGYIFEVTRKPNATVNNQTWVNNNKFVHDKNYLGGKNGYTDEANHTLVTTFSMPLSEFKNRNVAIVLLHSSNKQEDARAILQYLLANVYYGGNKDGSTIHERGFDESIFEDNSNDLEE
jgi:D-alanyl-D-alanine carboxypeptidase (penicillin-binding protein 5/6)